MLADEAFRAVEEKCGAEERTTITLDDADDGKGAGLWGQNKSCSKSYVKVERSVNRVCMCLSICGS
jgi:hypothetical protein